MKTTIKKKGNGKTDPEHPSTIIVRSRDGEREYWTGEAWADTLTRAHKYLRADAEKKLKGKRDAFVITLGFRNR